MGIRHGGCGKRPPNSTPAGTTASLPPAGARCARPATPSPARLDSSARTRSLGSLGITNGDGRLGSSPRACRTPRSPGGCISPKTVEIHVAILVPKTGQPSRRELVADAARPYQRRPAALERNPSGLAPSGRPVPWGSRRGLPVRWACAWCAGSAAALGPARALGPPLPGPAALAKPGISAGLTTTMSQRCCPPARRGTATMGHRCCGNSIHGPPLRLPAQPQQSIDVPSLLLRARGWPRSAWRAREPGTYGRLWALIHLFVRRPSTR